MKADDFLGQYQTTEQYGVASTEKAKVENLADRLRIEITAAGTVCATPPMIRAWSPFKLRSTECLKAILWKHDIAHQSPYDRKQFREYELR
jgi:hypothetical protein